MRWIQEIHDTCGLRCAKQSPSCGELRVAIGVFRGSESQSFSKQALVGRGSRKTLDVTRVRGVSTPKTMLGRQSCRAAGLWADHACMLATSGVTARRAFRPSHVLRRRITFTPVIILGLSGASPHHIRATVRYGRGPSPEPSGLCSVNGGSTGVKSGLGVAGGGSVGPDSGLCPTGGSLGPGPGVGAGGTGWAGPGSGP